MKETRIYERPKTWARGVHTHYCPGCGHGILHRLICEIIDEMGIQNDTIGTAPVGCAALMYDYIDIDFCEAAHGRAPALATGIRETRPDKIVFTYQGDGDLASIGTAEIIHVANRGEKTDHHLHQQRDLRNDRWADGSHHTDRAESNHLSFWQGSRACRIPHENVRDAGYP